MGIFQLPKEASSNVLVPWLAPTPTDKAIHRLFVILLKQPPQFRVDSMEEYSSPALCDGSVRWVGHRRWLPSHWHACCMCIHVESV